jgi:hypothetical protein
MFPFGTLILVIHLYKYINAVSMFGNWVFVLGEGGVIGLKIRSYFFLGKFDFGLFVKIFKVVHTLGSIYFYLI